MKYSLDPDLGITEENSAQFDTPERALWVAVVQRAVEDYARFFQVIAHSHNESKTERSNRLKTDRNHSWLTRAAIDLRHLHNFIYCKTPKPFNLSYIADVCSLEDGYVQRIRDQCEFGFVDSLQWAKAQNFHDAVCALASNAIPTSDEELAYLEETIPETPHKGRPRRQSALRH